MIGQSIVSSQEDGLDKLAKHARLVLLVIAGVQAAAVAFYLVAGGTAEEALIVPTAVSAAIYGGLAVWARRSPMPAVTIGAVVWASSVVIVVINGGSLFDGILFKVILLALFLNGLSSARAYNEAKRRLATTSKG